MRHRGVSCSSIKPHIPEIWYTSTQNVTRQQAIIICRCYGDIWCARIVQRCLLIQYYASCAMLLLLLTLSEAMCHTCYYSASCLISGSAGTCPSQSIMGTHLQGNLVSNQLNVRVCGSGVGPQGGTEPLCCKKTVTRRSRPESLIPLILLF